ncbi:uncharacterized protein MONOS_17090 [Monocercomonoides exilis]|uniref:uncharacterized protein n=1 Tax=Monocercomonoides exilis TaxID=2049356 RepID=UPI00355ABF5D|nr:hypothetical protein MONOS_17090 [Monocercomonoides exilis]
MLNSVLSIIFCLSVLTQPTTTFTFQGDPELFAFCQNKCGGDVICLQECIVQNTFMFTNRNPCTLKPATKVVTTTFSTSSNSPYVHPPEATLYPCIGSPPCVSSCNAAQPPCCISPHPFSIDPFLQSNFGQPFIPPPHPSAPFFSPPIAPAHFQSTQSCFPFCPPPNTLYNMRNSYQNYPWGSEFEECCPLDDSQSNSFFWRGSFGNRALLSQDLGGLNCSLQQDKDSANKAKNDMFLKKNTSLSTLESANTTNVDLPACFSSLLEADNCQKQCKPLIGSRSQLTINDNENEKDFEDFEIIDDDEDENCEVLMSQFSSHPKRINQMHLSSTNPQRTSSYFKKTPPKAKAPSPFPALQSKGLYKSRTHRIK